MNWPWTAIMRSVALHACLSEPTINIWMKIDPYCLRQKCSPGIVVSSEIKFMRIFAGVRWRGGFKWELGRQKGDFRLFYLLYLPNFHIKGHNYYTVLLVCTTLVALQSHPNRWPWMTLNGHFALKPVSGSATYELAFLDFRQNCSKICRATHILSATKM